MPEIMKTHVWQTNFLYSFAIVSGNIIRLYEIAVIPAKYIPFVEILVSEKSFIVLGSFLKYDQYLLEPRKKLKLSVAVVSFSSILFYQTLAAHNCALDFKGIVVEIDIFPFESYDLRSA